MIQEPENLLRRLHSRDVEFVIIGGICGVLHGGTLVTQDLDVCCRFSPENLRKLEEAFYRGYLQSRLDDAWPPRWRLLGATVGPGLLVASAIFALGHVATVHLATRLAVFFPALLFGWLRARTGGIGASVCFHMICNVYSQALGRGYGIY